MNLNSVGFTSRGSMFKNHFFFFFQIKNENHFPKEKDYWRRKWQNTPVFLPGESQGQQSLVGCHLWGRTESDTTEVT